MSFIFIKIILRAMKFNYGPKKKGKINMILAITTNKIINYLLTNENINSENF